MTFPAFTIVLDALLAENMTARKARILIVMTGTAEVKMADLAVAAKCSTAAITGQMDDLTRTGYVTRGHDSNDRRKVVPQLTEKGRLFLKKISELQIQ